MHIVNSGFLLSGGQRQADIDVISPKASSFRCAGAETNLKKSPLQQQKYVPSQHKTAGFNIILIII